MRILFYPIRNIRGSELEIHFRMGRTDDLKTMPQQTNGTTRPAKARQKRGRQKVINFKPQVITFSCIFCNLTCENTNLLFDHMRRVHPNLCEIPQITADSEIVEEISGSEAKKPKEESVLLEKHIVRPAREIEDLIESPASTISEDKQQHQYLSEDENSVGHLIEMVGSEEEQQEEVAYDEEEEEIESPPYDSISSEEPATEKNSKKDEETERNSPEESEAGEEENDDDDIYLSLMEPICELRNCNESEAEEFQNKLLESIKSTTVTSSKPGRGRRRDYNEDTAAGEVDGSSGGGGEGFFQCTVCNKSFTYAGELARHVRSHTLNKPYQCSVSNQSQQSNLFSNILVTLF